MTIELILLSKPHFTQIRKLVEMYQGRLQRYCKMEEKIFKDEKRLRKHLEQSDGTLVILDESGTSASSTGLASQLLRWQESGRQLVQFCVGGPYGWSLDFKKKADWRWRLSDLTLPGDFAWLLLHEQLFRAFSILHKTGYHHGSTTGV